VNGYLILDLCLIANKILFFIAEILFDLIFTLLGLSLNDFFIVLRVFCFLGV